MTSPEVIVKKKNVVFDATLLSTLQSCARLADFRFNYHLKSLHGDSNAIECGSIAHKILEVYYKSRRDGLKREDAIGQGMIAGQMYISGCAGCANFKPHLDQDGSDNVIVKPPCGHQPNEYPGVVNIPPDNQTKPKRTGWKWVLETMNQYFKHYQFNDWEAKSVEEVKMVKLYEDDEINIYWKAKLDTTVLTPAGLLPMDHKTMSQDRDSTKMHNQFIGQCFIEETRTMIVNKIGFQTNKKPEEKFKRVMHSYSADNLLEWQSEIVPFWAYQYLTFAEAEYYPPRWSNCENKYGKCQFIDVCMNDRNMREEELRLSFVVGEKWDPTNV